MLLTEYQATAPAKVLRMLLVTLGCHIASRGRDMTGPRAGSHKCIKRLPMPRRSLIPIPLRFLVSFESTLPIPAFIALLLPILAGHALPGKRDDIDVAPSLITGADTSTPAVLSLTSVLHSGVSSGVATASASFIPTPSIMPNAAQRASSEASELLDIASADINQLPSESRSDFTAFVTTVSGAPMVEISSNGGTPLTLATATSAVTPTVFAGHTILIVPPSSPPHQNGASGLSVSRPLLTGILGALGALVSGAMMLL